MGIGGPVFYSDGLPRDCTDGHKRDPASSQMIKEKRSSDLIARDGDF